MILRPLKWPLQPFAAFFKLLWASWCLLRPLVPENVKSLQNQCFYNFEINLASNSQCEWDTEVSFSILRLTWKWNVLSWALPCLMDLVSLRMTQNAYFSRVTLLDPRECHRDTTTIEWFVRSIWNNWIDYHFMTFQVEHFFGP